MLVNVSVNIDRLSSKPIHKYKWVCATFYSAGYFPDRFPHITYFFDMCIFLVYFAFHISFIRAIFSIQ
jgi:hypothetical protein